MKELDLKEGRRLVSRFEPVTGDRFGAMRAAEKACKEKGLVAGSHQRGSPRGLMRDDEYDYVAKWRNLTVQERRELHGVILFPGDGAAEIWLNQGEGS